MTITEFEKTKFSINTRIEHKSMLQIQLSSMKTYYEVLIQRLVLFMRGTPSN